MSILCIYRQNMCTMFVVIDNLHNTNVDVPHDLGPEKGSGAQNHYFSFGKTNGHQHISKEPTMLMSMLEKR